MLTTQHVLASAHSHKYHAVVGNSTRLLIGAVLRAIPTTDVLLTIALLLYYYAQAHISSSSALTIRVPRHLLIVVRAACNAQRAH